MQSFQGDVTPSQGLQVGHGNVQFNQFTIGTGVVSRAEPTYRATMRNVHRRTAQLQARTDELRELAGFATGMEGCRWLVGGAWAGKTALVAEAITTALPANVDVVGYFLSRREADADSNHFLNAVVPQLAYLLEDDSPVRDYLHAFVSLWQRSAARADSTGRHLLLVVDGLDEDLRPAGSPTVAGLLPSELGGYAHLLVTSRPYPELPFDVPVGHPLRQVRPVPLEPYKDAAYRSQRAQQEISDALHRGDVDLAASVFGLLTAAAAPLAVSDLVALASDDGRNADQFRKIHRLLTEDSLARSLEQIGPAGAPRYQFAHSSLLEYSQADGNLSHPYYRERIYQWADQWRDAGWPATESSHTSTPRYLLEGYPATLGSDPSRLAALVSDIGWVAAAIKATGVDSVLAVLRTAISAAPTHPGVFSALTVVLGEAHCLRPYESAGESGYVLRQLCLYAAELTDSKLTADLRGRLQTVADAGPIPRWTTCRASRALAAEIHAPGGTIQSLALLPDGRVVTGGGDRRVRLWDPTATEPPVDLGEHGDVVRAVAVLPDGQVVSGGDDRRVLLWNPATPGAAPLELGRHGRPVRAVAALPDGRVVSGGDDWRVLMWKPAAAGGDNAPVRLGSHDSMVLAVAALLDGRVVSGGDDRRVLLWDPRTPGAAPLELGRHPRAVRALAVRRDGRRVVSGGDDQRVRMWDPAAPHRLVGLARHGGRVLAVKVLPDGRVVSGGENWIRVWDFTPGGAAPIGLGGHDDIVRALDALPDGRVVSGGDDQRVRAWDPALGGIPIAAGNSGTARTVAVFPDGRVVSGGYDRRVLLWDPRAASMAPVELGHHEHTVGAVAVLRDGRVVSGGYDHRVLLWDPRAPGAAPVELGRHRRGIGAIAPLRDGRVAVSSADDLRILICDPAAKGGFPVALGYHRRGVGAIAVMTDGRLVSGGYDHRVLMWNPKAVGRDPVELGRHEDAIRAIAVLPDGRVITGGDDRRIRLWDPSHAGAGPTEVGRHDGAVLSIVSLPDGQVVTCAEDRSVRVWRPALGIESARVLRSAVALAVGDAQEDGYWQLVMAHEGGGISGWGIRPSAALFSLPSPPSSPVSRRHARRRPVAV